MSGAADAVDDVIVTREEWARQMRRWLSPPEMLDENGDLMDEYFRPKAHELKKERKWGEEERKRLIQGIEHHGVGSNKQIKEDYLPDWEPNEIRIKTMNALGRQCLTAYKGWKGPEKAVLQEHKRNEDFAKKHGLWKGSTLVAADDKTISLPPPIIWTRKEDGSWESSS